MPVPKKQIPVPVNKQQQQQQQQQQQTLPKQPLTRTSSTRSVRQPPPSRSSSVKQPQKTSSLAHPAKKQQLPPLQPAASVVRKPSSPSPSAESAPGPALGAGATAQLSRSLSAASATTRDSRDSLGSDASAVSHQSSGSYTPAATKTPPIKTSLAPTKSSSSPTKSPTKAASSPTKRVASPTKMATPKAKPTRAAAAPAPAAAADPADSATTTMSTAPAPPTLSVTTAPEMLTPFPDLPGTGPSAPLTPTSQQHLSKRRGYVRPQGTDFAASARSRESVLSLGSIAHLQHYFARTGLLDLKGQLERRRRRGLGKARTLDLSQLDPSSYLNYGGLPANATANANAAKARPVSMLTVPTYILNDGEGTLVTSPIQEEGAEEDEEVGEDGETNADDESWYDESYDPDPAELLPPTVSTYQNREKPVPKPPSQAELRADLVSSLDNAVKVLADAREQGSRPPTATALSAAAKGHQHTASGGSLAGLGAVAPWHEVQGMLILDVLTLAIRAAKLYYTGHEQPDRLDAIKPEKEVRSELLGVMDVLRRMATRNFVGGTRPEELTAMDEWVAGLYEMLKAEDEIVAAERAERASWIWLQAENWPAVPAGELPAPADRERAYAREHAFMVSMLGKDGEELPAWTPLDRTEAEAAKAAAESSAESADAESIKAPRSPKSIRSIRSDDDGPGPDTPPPPTEFLHHLQSGVRLVELHNCAVYRSHRRFGAIPTFHANTQKPYRAADNLRFWGKAAELRWEVLLKINALGIVYNTGPIIWADFEDAIYQWCRKVREEITSEVDD